MYIEITYPRFKAFTDEGLPAEGYKVYTYEAGGSTEATTYNDRLLSSENTFPIILDAAGECLIFTNIALKLVLTTDADDLVWTMDYLGEQQQVVIITAEATPGTTNNNYSADVVPPYATIPDSLTLIFTPDVDSEATVNDTIFTGSGKNDCVISGPYLGTTSGSVFSVEIQTNGAPDTVRWKKDGGAWHSDIGITSDHQTMQEGMSFRFSEGSGHTIGDIWTAEVLTPARLEFCGLGPYLIYKNLNGVLTGLDAKDMLAGIPATLVWSEDNTCWILNNPATLSQSGSSTAGERSRKQFGNENYTLLLGDKGNLIDFRNTTDQSLYLGPAINYIADDGNQTFYYIRAGGTGNVIIRANGAELIYGPRYPDGNSTYTLFGGCGDVVQLQCNGVSWEVLTTVGHYDYNTEFITTSVSYYPQQRSQVVLVIVRGGGGASATTISGSGGGGGGGAAWQVVPVSSMTLPISVTIGGGASAGGTGGTTSFGPHVSATGGSPGYDGGGGAGGYGVGGMVNINGEYGGSNGDYGGASRGWGGAARSTVGNDGNNYGGGGGGTVGGTGKSGAGGMCQVFEFPTEQGLVPYVAAGIVKDIVS